MYLVKLSLAVVLAGGVGRNGEEGSKVRAESHLLLVGDPGTGKSEILKFARRMSPRSVLTTGVGTTTAGLTVSALRENGEWHLEAGALVLSDGGICCIDEFSSIKEHDRTSIHEAMEQQTISVAKAGLVCKLNTRCSIIAACNPKGHYDPNIPITVNIAIASPLLSRFDLVLVLLDSRNEEWDKMVSNFILFGKRLRPSNKLATSLWDIEKLQAYFYVIKGLRPQMTLQANKILSKYYQEQRKADVRNAARTTVRLLESLIRLSQAHARLMFRNEVLVQDAIQAICLIESCMLDTSIIGDKDILHKYFPTHPGEEYEKQLTNILKILNLEEILSEELESIEKNRIKKIQYENSTNDTIDDDDRNKIQSTQQKIEISQEIRHVLNNIKKNKDKHIYESINKQHIKKKTKENVQQKRKIIGDEEMMREKSTKKRKNDIQIEDFDERENDFEDEIIQSVVERANNDETEDGKITIQDENMKKNQNENNSDVKKKADLIKFNVKRKNKLTLFDSSDEDELKGGDDKLENKTNSDKFIDEEKTLKNNKLTLEEKTKLNNLEKLIENYRSSQSQTVQHVKKSEQNNKNDDGNNDRLENIFLNCNKDSIQVEGKIVETNTKYKADFFHDSDSDLDEFEDDFLSGKVSSRKPSNHENETETDQNNTPNKLSSNDEKLPSSLKSFVNRSNSKKIIVHKESKLQNKINPIENSNKSLYFADLEKNKFNISSSLQKLICNSKDETKKEHTIGNKKQNFITPSKSDIGLNSGFNEITPRSFEKIVNATKKSTDSNEKTPNCSNKISSKTISKLKMFTFKKTDEESLVTERKNSAKMNDSHGIDWKTKNIVESEEVENVKRKIVLNGINSEEVILDQHTLGVISKHNNETEVKGLSKHIKSRKETLNDTSNDSEMISINDVETHSGLFDRINNSFDMFTSVENTQQIESFVDKQNEIEKIKNIFDMLDDDDFS